MLCELLTTYSQSFSTVSSKLNVKKKLKLDPRHKVSSSQTVDLVFLYFILIFIFFSIYFLTFLFLKYRVRVIDGHESQDAWNEVEGSRINDIIQHGYYILTSCSTHGHLG